MDVNIKQVYPGLESVVDPGGNCLGVVIKSCRYPYAKMFFCYEDCCCYHGMSSFEAYAASQHQED